MRITINLSIYFHDHRSLAKIFINKKMRCIQDLQQHISGIFNINDFYLKCDNQYLPPTEDVQILHNDEVVWVVPNETLEETPIIEQKKKKKKKYDIGDTKNQEEIVSKEKVNKSKKRKVQKNPIENAIEIDEPITKKKKKKMKKNREPEVSVGATEEVESNNTEINRTISEDFSIKDSDQGFLVSAKEESTLLENQEVNVKSLVSSFEKKQDNSSKNIFEISPKEPKRINIIKTIIVSNQPNLADKSNLKTPEPKESIESENASLIQLNNSNVMEENNLNETSDNLESSSSICYSTLTEMDINVNKRRRKRVRKRRHTFQKNLDSSVEQPVQFINSALIKPPPRHLRFSDGDNLEIPVINGVKEPNNQTKESLNNEVIEINESVNLQEPVKPSNFNVTCSNKEEQMKSSNFEISYSNEQIEECILKQPITRNVEPKTGDVIAFKILRISDDYTPEVSSTIVGKVIEYNLESKEIAFNIVYGHNQCLLPQGKFSLNHDEEPVEEKPQFQCLWSNLLEPRLIFP